MWNHHLSVTSPQGNTYQNSGRFSANWPPSISGRIKECLGPFDRSHLAQLTVGDILRSELIGAMLEKLQKKPYKSRFNDMMKWYNIGGCFWFLLQQSGSNYIDVSGLGASRYCEAPPCWRDDFGLALYRMEKIGVMSTKKKIESFRINILDHYINIEHLKFLPNMSGIFMHFWWFLTTTSTKYFEFHLPHLFGTTTSASSSKCALKASEKQRVLLEILGVNVSITGFFKSNSYTATHTAIWYMNVIYDMIWYGMIWYDTIWLI